MLKTAKKFPKFYNAVEVHLIERSNIMIEKQGKSLYNFNKDISWHAALDLVPEKPMLLIAQEFLDALPVHQFQFTEDGWREILVHKDTLDGPHHFKLVLSPNVTPASVICTRENDILSLDYLVKDPKVGDRIEASPAVLGVVQGIARRIRKFGGSSLMIDYGHEGALPSSIRGIKNHKFVDSLSEPGLVDLSADIDFKSIARVGEDMNKHDMSKPLNLVNNYDDVLKRSKSKRNDADKLLDDLSKMDSPDGLHPMGEKLWEEVKKKVDVMKKLDPEASQTSEALKSLRSQAKSVTDAAGAELPDGMKKSASGLIIDSTLKSGDNEVEEEKTGKILTPDDHSNNPFPDLNNDLLMDEKTKLDLQKAKAKMEIDLEKIEEQQARKIIVNGPITQGRWLHNMGIRQRMQILSQNMNENDAENLFGVYQRLVEPDQMGSIYKVISFSSSEIKYTAGYTDMA